QNLFFFPFSKCVSKLPSSQFSPRLTQGRAPPPTPNNTSPSAKTTSLATKGSQITECQNRITNYQNQITEFQKQIDHPEPQERGNWGACMTKCMIKWGKRIPGKKSDAGCLVFCDSQCMKLQNYLPSEDRVRGVCILKALDDGRDEHV
ncbi:hypothetical protein PoMZ_12665, partial [Pyricularia oryzae]